MIYAIGDIHGQLTQLHRALALIETDGGVDAQIVFLGDYTDRGPDSRGVLDLLIEGQTAGRNWHIIKGNHDRMFRRYVDQAREHDPRIASGLSWLNPRLGGMTTLASYGISGEPTFGTPASSTLETLTSYTIDGTPLTPSALHRQVVDAVPQAHMDFIDKLPLTFESGELLFVHAGIRPGVPMPQQDPDDLLWIRDGWLDDTRDHGPLIVHGHTALETPRHFGNRVDLDGGAGYGRPLTPAVFEGRSCWILTDTGREPLQP